MPPVQGTGKTPTNIANPNMPSTGKPSSVAGDKATPTKTTTPVAKKATPASAGAGADTDSAAQVAQSDPAKAIEKLETRTKAVNANNVARVANSQLTSNDEKLHPLVSLKTGKTLEKFPETSKDIQKLTRMLIAQLSLRVLVVSADMQVVINVDNMLSNLEADRAGNEAAKRERLRVQIGLKPNPA